MTRNLDDFYDAYYYLFNHPIFFYKGTLADKCEPGFAENLDIAVTKVCPLTDRIEDDRSRNTKTAVWVECGGYEDPTQEWEMDNAQWVATGISCHNMAYDTGGDTFEEAIINLARKVMEEEGDYVDYDICSHCLRRRPCPDGRDENEHWYCSDVCREHGPYSYEFVPAQNTYVFLSKNDCEHFPK